MTTTMTADDIRSAMRKFDARSEDNIDRAIRALADGGAVEKVVAARPIKSGSYLGLVGTSGSRVAWLHVGHIDIVDELAPQYAFPSGVYPGISRVAFPGYSEAATSTSSAVAPLPCQECFNAVPYCECE